MIVDEEVYLEHYGVQGMKWGVRREANKTNVATLRAKGLTRRQAKNTNRAQNSIDKQRMAASGRQGKVHVLKQLRNRAASNQMLNLSTIVKHPLSTQKAAQLQLEKNKVTQAKIANGQKRVKSRLLKMQGVSIKDLNFDT